MSRIQEMFASLRKKNERAFIPYIPVGYPTTESSEELIKAICESGADLVELGVPYSDPLADGPTIQEAGGQALANGTSLLTCIAMVASLRRSCIETPIVLMGYCNSFLSYGLNRLAIDAAEAGVDGFIIADLPSTMAEQWENIFRVHGLDLIFFLSPTTNNNRLASVVQKGSGFLYCISRNGVTGMRDQIPEELRAFINHIRSVTNLPLCVGFGISNAKQVSEVSEYADGVIVGSALINVIKKADPQCVEKEVRSYIQSLKEATKVTSSYS